LVLRREAEANKRISLGVSRKGASSEQAGVRREMEYYAKRDRRGMRHSRDTQLGGGMLKAIVWTILLVYGAFAAYKILPAYVAQYQLADKMQEQARYAQVNRYSEEQIRDNIFKVVQDLDIPVKKEQIKVVDTISVVRISMEYTVPVDLLVYHVDLHFTPSSENKSIM
jgi:uncharacterized membrane protein